MVGYTTESPSVDRVGGGKVHISPEAFEGTMGFKAIDYKEVPLEEANEEGAVGAKIRWLISEKDGAENFSMRYFEIDEEGRSPVHNHPWEHEVFILKGRCRVVCDQEVAELGPGGVILVPENTDHNFQNVGEGALEFICVIPNVD